MPGAKHLKLWTGSVIAAILFTCGILSLFWTPFPTDTLNISNRLQLPGSEHWFGTDHLGRDIFSMILAGSANSILVALIAVFIGAAIGIPLGSYAARREGLIDTLLMRGSDFVFAFPSVLSAVIITAHFGPGAINAMIAIGIFNIPVFARLTRNASKTLWQQPFIMAARLAGKNDLLIIIEHILPNLVSIFLVQLTIQFSLAILAEAGLSYLGLGAQPPEPSWGRMLADAQTFIFLAPHVTLIPGIAISLSVLGMNLAGDGLRDYLDPKLYAGLKPGNAV